MNRSKHACLAALLALPSLSGCKGACISPCEKLYLGADSCEIMRPGTSQEDLYEACMDHCGEAMAQSGDIGDYDPDERQGSSAAASLENRAQAQAWIECIEETSCEDLNLGYCAPVW